MDIAMNQLLPQPHLNTSEAQGALLGLGILLMELLVVLMQRPITLLVKFKDPYQYPLEGVQLVIAYMEVTRQRLHRHLARLLLLADSMAYQHMVPQATPHMV